jgi:hypothetical protein
MDDREELFKTRRVFMTFSISLNYTTNLPTLLANKLSFGRVAKGGYQLEGFYEADKGWDNLFVDYLAKRVAPHRAGATAIDISAQVVGKIVLPRVSELTFSDEPQPAKTKE